MPVSVVISHAARSPLWGLTPSLWLFLAQDSWRRAVSTGVRAGIPMPCFTTALSFYDGYRHETLPANLIQVSFRSRW